MLVGKDDKKMNLTKTQSLVYTLSKTGIVNYTWASAQGVGLPLAAPYLFPGT